MHGNDDKNMQRVSDSAMISIERNRRYNVVAHVIFGFQQTRRL